MNGRCYVRTNTSYIRYGARGITVCDRWRNSFEAFLQDVGERPSDDMSIERIDNTKGYEPGNVRWATRLEQGANKRNNRRITINGETKTAAEWVRATGIKRSTLWMRANRGVTGKQLLEAP